MSSTPESPARTRDCTDPWQEVFVHADRGVALCCWAPRIGSLETHTLEEIVQGRRARQIRAGLLDGSMDEGCRTCPARGWTSPLELSRKVEQVLGEDPLGELETLRARIFWLENDREQLRLHAGTLESDLEQLHLHADTIGSDREQLRLHAGTLAAELEPLRRHAGTLETERDQLGLHAGTLETEVEHLRLHAHALEAERDALRGHTSNLEGERERLRGHVANLERILTKIHGVALYRVLGRVKSFFVGQRPPS